MKTPLTKVLKKLLETRDNVRLDWIDQTGYIVMIALVGYITLKG